jgi:hypothetical protein
VRGGWFGHGGKRVPKNILSTILDSENVQPKQRSSKTTTKNSLRLDPAKPEAERAIRSKLSTENSCKTKSMAKPKIMNWAAKALSDESKIHRQADFDQ